MHRPSRRLAIGAVAPDLTPSQVAMECGVTHMTVLRWIKRRKDPLPARRMDDGRWLVAREDLLRWLGGWWAGEAKEETER